MRRCSIRFAALSLGLSLGAVSLAACGHSAPTRIFTLDAVAPQAPAPAYAGAPFRVDAVHLPSALDRVEVVRQTMADRLEVSDFDHWGAPLGDLARRALTQDLAARLPAGLVIYPDTPKPPGSGGLVVDVLAFQRTDQGYVLDASWTLQPGVAGSATVSRQLRLTDQDAGATGAGADGEAAALSRLLGRLADAVAGGLAAG